MSQNIEREKALSSWLAEVSVTGRASDEEGIFLNEIIFTHKNGGRLCLILFDVNILNEESLNGEYYKAAEETLEGLPKGFPTVNSVMYTEAAAVVSKRGSNEFLY